MASRQHRYMYSGIPQEKLKSLNVFPYILYSACCRCANLECSSEYDMDFIESQLIDMVQKQSMAFVLQDLKCGKCHGVSILTCACYLFC